MLSLGQIALKKKKKISRLDIYHTLLIGGVPFKSKFTIAAFFIN